MRTQRPAFGDVVFAIPLLRAFRWHTITASLEPTATEETLDEAEAAGANMGAFVRDLVDNPEDAAIVRAIVQMAHSLDLATIAEGVEDAATLALLTRYGCDIAQGWCIGKPLPVGEFDIAAINERMRNDLKMVA